MSDRLKMLLIGNESLLIQCAEAALTAGHDIVAVVTRSQGISNWAQTRNVPVISADEDLVARCSALSFDWLLSIANLDMLPQALLEQAQKGAVNFHDGPLPHYAGLNAPVWALIHGERHHGITWHLMQARADTGNILVQRMFDIGPKDTALTLNTRCYEAAIESFDDLLGMLTSEDVAGTPQDLNQRSYFAGNKPIPPLDFADNSADVARLIRALDHGEYWNPVGLAKIEIAGQVFAVGAADDIEGGGMPGTVVAVAEDMTIACAQGAVRLSGLRDMSGKALRASDVVRVGTKVDAARADIPPSNDAFWRGQLANFLPAQLPLIGDASDANYKRYAIARPDGMTSAQIWQALAGFALNSGCEIGSSLAYVSGALPVASGYLTDWVPVPLGDAMADVALVYAEKGAIAVDLPLRDAELPHLTCPDLAVLDVGVTPVSAVNIVLGDTLHMVLDRARVEDQHATRLVARFEAALRCVSEGREIVLLDGVEQDELLHLWNATDCAFDDVPMHSAFEAQVLRTPEATAVVYEDQSLSYDELNRAANRVGHQLQAMGVVPGALVGLYCTRSLDMMIGVLGILKAGGAYVPLDPAYPQDRLAHYIQDSQAGVIVTQSAIQADLPTHNAQVLVIDDVQDGPDANPDSGVTGNDLAYVIYTSGSTGVPKGVMVEHRNVANFFAGMDERVQHDPAGTWLALTSLSFDISVLELFYTLARGFKVVISGDDKASQISNGFVANSAQGMEFSIYYWGNDDAPGSGKYRLLLEGAKFADQNGFCAVWTPERHFHAFGGPYPNPSVTGAAAAAVTHNIGIRAGSCVAPLHHTARIAEEWAVIDNLTNGRAGLAIASGWQPDDFVLWPDHTPPENRTVMFEQMKDLRALWRGEAVEFARKDGSMFAARTQPRPVSKELELWVTTAGNPQTWKDAGKAGAHILTHLLGQSVAEVQEKIGLYHAELRKAGHDPKDFKVTLMLHTFVGHDREEVRETAREPMKNYLRSAAGLIKQYAWAFPAFKKPKGVDNPFQLDLGILSDDELEEILDFAFLRYFEDSGLFGTVEDCLARVEELKSIGVAEVACLIDYGIDTDVVLEGLKPLAEVLQRANSGAGPAEGDYSIAAQIHRHKVTHLQCTPSMARMLVGDDAARASMGILRHVMIGGEALPTSLAIELQTATDAHIENMYGPTETTIWSTTGKVDVTTSASVADLGTPIANTRLYVLDDQHQPVAVGVAGELWIAGAGVTRGYWQREAMTAERFLDDPFAGQGRMYRTGDLVRWRGDGRLDFLGRADHQVKLRGYRIELGEIEARLEALPGVSQAVVITREDQPGDQRLVGYVTGGAAGAALRVALSRDLPDFMVPTHIVTLDSFPLTPNKKINRNALPAPQMAKPAPATTAPEEATSTGDLAKQIGAIWSRILGVVQVSGRDNFFELGGHSLLAVQAHREIRDGLGIAKVSITDIFRFPVLNELASQLEKRAGKLASPRATDTPSGNAPSTGRAQGRSDAMAKRRAMRAKRNKAAQ